MNRIAVELGGATSLSSDATLQNFYIVKLFELKKTRIYRKQIAKWYNLFTLKELGVL
jgi:hypothetical protein